MKPISSPISEIRPRYDVIVIGSGYGGGIASSRLARAGRSVCLLERGREILVGDYPDTLPEALNDLQVHAPEGHLGSRIGLFDLHVNKQQNAVVGCGLGGTSLINANVSLKPKPEVFEHEAWPREVREHRDTLLKEGYERAEAMLRPNPYPEDWPTPAKTAAHGKSAEGMGKADNFYRPPINVTFETPPGGVNHVGVPQQKCTNCGDCVTGCNYAAKNTTLMNYLPDAWNHGAEIFCQADVRYIERSDDGWLVHYQYVDVGREKFDAPTMTVRGDIVVVSAGTLGSNEILLRSRAKGLSTSDRLGRGFSGNGDILGFGYNCDQEIHGIGFGSTPPGELPDVGPCITSIIDLREGDDRTERMVIEEGSLPGAIGSTLPAAFAAAAGLIGEDTDTGFIDKLRELGRTAESVLRGPYHGAVDNTQTFLIMSHDDVEGRLELNDEDRMVIHWPEVGEEPNFIHGNRNLEAATAALGGNWVKDPIWTKPFGESVVTVHPLGGCSMGSDGAQGAVDHKGRLFTGSGTEVHEGLYVSDGSVIPTSLAVNPLFTISAVTERCCVLMAQDHGWEIDYTLPSAPSRAHREIKPGVRFTETMRGFFSTEAVPGEARSSYEDADAAGQRAESGMDFTLTIFSHDIDELLETDAHPARISGTVNCAALSAAPLSVSEGHFNLFERMPEPPDTRHMIYAMVLTAETGESYYFKGYKVVRNNPNVLDIWPDTSTLYVSVHAGTDDSGALLGKGILHIEPADFLRQMTTMEVTGPGSRMDKLANLARFGKFFAGVLWDTYAGVFHAPERSDANPPRRRRELRAPAPEVFGVTTADDVNLRLTRYRGGSKGPVMLVHGLGVASTIFSTDLIETNLLEYLVANGYDVWLLDYRVSILLPSAAQQWNGDQVAQNDYPAAVARIREVTGADSVQAVVHCYGGTTFFMSMLAGLEGVRSIVCSQIATDIVVPTATAVKTGLHVPSFLDKLGLDSLDADARGDDHSLFERMYDKALSIYALAEAQGQCDNASCHRITFMYAPLYRHETLNDALHENLGELFGVGNMETFQHLALMCREGRLVNRSGDDVYLPNLARLELPILFLSGEQNECYLPESTAKTYARLREAFDPGLFERRVIPGYGHIDCIFGRNASRDVFPHIVAHLEATAG